MKFLQLFPITMMFFILLITLLPQTTEGGPLAYGICQSGCNALAGACYAAAGCVFGTIAAVAAPSAIMACNAGLGTCMASCIAAGCSPTP